MKWYQKNIDIESVFPTTHTDKYDIICPAVGNVEVKEDLLAVHTGNYAIEFENYEGKPSGVNVTEAQQFVLIDQEYVTIMKTESLKFILREIPHKKTVGMGYTDEGGKRCKGWLIPRDKIIMSPYAMVMERWFKWQI